MTKYQPESNDLLMKILGEDFLFLEIFQNIFQKCFDRNFLWKRKFPVTLLIIQFFEYLNSKILINDRLNHEN